MIVTFPYGLKLFRHCNVTRTAYCQGKPPHTLNRSLLFAGNAHTPNMGQQALHLFIRL